MAIEDDTAGRWGVQFHPESILTWSGHELLATWLELAAA